jgi:GNAT superfamily N-acetyltransferase
MFLRCSVQTRYRRFHGFLESFPEPYFTEALEGRAEHLALVAETPTGIVALASCAAGELGVLVEDAYQRQGIGARLLETLIARSGYGAFLASVQAEQSWILPFLRRYSQIKIDII